VLIALIARSARRRPAKAGWRSRLVNAYAKGSALHDAMSVAEAPGGLAASFEFSLRALGPPGA
jgi:hypothetical protein